MKSKGLEYCRLLYPPIFLAQILAIKSSQGLSRERPQIGFRSDFRTGMKSSMILT